MKLLDFFEGLIEPFPDAADEQPPGRLLPFLWFYVRGSWPYLLMMAMLSGIISVLEISIFGFLGNLVDWLGARDPQSFFTCLLYTSPSPRDRG